MRKLFSCPLDQIRYFFAGARRLERAEAILAGQAEETARHAPVMAVAPGEKVWGVVVVHVTVGVDG